jgi:cysteine synthase A
LKSLVGNTPLLAIEFTYRGQKRVIYTKAENLNMTGSIKDRMALHILAQGYEKEVLKPGDLIVEATSGNTGISFSAIGRALGHPVAIFMPDWMSPERIKLIKSFGSQIHLVSEEEGGFLASIERADATAAETERAFLPKQFANEDNIAAHFNGTGTEIWYQLRTRALVPDAFVAGVGTGGTIMGVGRFLRGQHPPVKIHPVEPSNSPTMSTGHRVGKHRIQGISDEFIPPIVHLNEMDDIIEVDDGDAILMAQKLASQLGLGVGISSGCNFLAAIQVQEQLSPDAVIVTVFPDSNKKYLSTDLFHEEPTKDGFLTPEITLRGFHSFRRVCQTCFDLEDYEDLPANFPFDGKAMVRGA